MPIFTVTASVTVSTYTTVEANTKEEALKIANDRPIEIYMGHDSKEASMEAWIIEDADGEPMNIEIA